MKIRIITGLIVAVACLVLPYLCRLPFGLAWVNQYRPDDGYFSVGMLFFQAFAIIPSIFTFLSALVSRAPYYLPVILSSLAAFGILVLFHSTNDLAADAQSALTLIFIPVFAAGGAFLAGAIGLAIQEIRLKSRIVAEQDDASDPLPFNSRASVLQRISMLGILTLFVGG